MRQFTVLISQILIISCIQSLTELFVDPGERPYQAKIINIACFAGSLYLLIQFVFEFLIAELSTVINFSFPV